VLCIGPTNPARLGRQLDSPCNWLSRVILDFSMAGWFEFFGVKWISCFHINSTESSGHMLVAMPQLAQLQMWFRSPGDGWKGYPWRRYDITAPWICCQRVKVDWVMTFAWPFVNSWRCCEEGFKGQVARAARVVDCQEEHCRRSSCARASHFWTRPQCCCKFTQVAISIM
jgi:hypothetical protein